MNSAFRGAVLLCAFATTARADPTPPAPAPAPASAPVPAPVSDSVPVPVPDSVPVPVAATGPVAAPAPAGFPEAQPRPEKRIPDFRFVVNNLFVFRYNPVGIEDQIRAGIQVRLFHSYDILFRDTFVH